MLFSKKILCAFLITSFSTLVFGQSPYVPGELLIRKKPLPELKLIQTNVTTLETWLSKHPAQSQKLAIAPPVNALFKGKSPHKDIYRVKFEPSSNLDLLMEDIKQLPDVDYVQKNYKFELFYLPNDPSISEQWHLDSVNISEAWDVSQGNSDVLIAVIDSGVDYNHPDLVNVMWKNPYVTGVSDTDGNEQPNDAIGWDFGSNANSGAGDNNPIDNMGHGTLVAGVAAAETDNGIGGAGIAFSAKILPIKVTDDSGGIDSAALIQAVYYASYHGADVINLSLGGTEPDDDTNRLLEDTINDAIDNGAVVVAAAGNIFTTAFDIDDEHIIPATYPRVFTVGGANKDGDYDNKVSLFGNSVDVIAPDTDIYGPSYSPSTKIRSYRNGTGTSFAAPIVSGICALLKAVNPLATPEEIMQAIIDTAEDKGSPGKDKYHGYGLVNAEAALNAIETGPKISFSNSSSRYLTEATTLNFTISDNSGISLNSIAILLTIGDQTKALKVGDAGVEFSTPNLIIFPEAYSELILDATLTVRISASDRDGVNTTKSFAFYKTDSLSLITLLNAPNPFDPNRESTTFHIELTQDSDIEMSIYSLGLQHIKSFPSEHIVSGYNTNFSWDGKDDSGRTVPNGVYILLFKATNGLGKTLTKRYKIAVLKR